MLYLQVRARDAEEFLAAILEFDRDSGQKRCAERSAFSPGSVLKTELDTTLFESIQYFAVLPVFKYHRPRTSCG